MVSVSKVLFVVLALLLAIAFVLAGFNKLSPAMNAELHRELK